jgi:diphthamide synthase (EF-2-diphthine--ammonia ligase)
MLWTKSQEHAAQRQSAAIVSEAVRNYGWSLETIFEWYLVRVSAIKMPPNTAGRHFIAMMRKPD